MGVGSAGCPARPPSEPGGSSADHRWTAPPGASSHGLLVHLRLLPSAAGKDAVIFDPRGQTSPSQRLSPRRLGGLGGALARGCVARAMPLLRGCRAPTYWARTARSTRVPAAASHGARRAWYNPIKARCCRGGAFRICDRVGDPLGQGIDWAFRTFEVACAGAIALVSGAVVGAVGPHCADGAWASLVERP